jgi:hypothetical protein
MSGCKNNSVSPESEQSLLYIAAENGFNNDSVKIELNGRVLLNKSITTNYSVDLAWLSQSQILPQGNQSVKISIINDDIIDSCTINLKDTVSLRINYDSKTRLITFSEYKGIIYRD